MLKYSKWLCMDGDYKTACPVFRKKFRTKKRLVHAILRITSVGCYEAYINNKRVGNFVFAPGWTSYEHRLQVQEYDVTSLIEQNNTMDIYVGGGWHLGRISNNGRHFYSAKKPAIILELVMTFEDGTFRRIVSDERFSCALSGILFSCIYDGEYFDAREHELKWQRVQIMDYTKDNLIPQEGEEIHEFERIKPISCNILLNGYQVIDFGQNITGYVEFECDAPEGTVIELVHGEILADNGDVYTGNLRGAKQEVKYIAGGKKMKYRPHFTFQGFRYIRVKNIVLDTQSVRAVVVHSDIRRTGYFECSNDMVNRLFQNTIWSQRGNYMDVPMDCPQRDERFGWTGDSQFFATTAAYNYDVHRFFSKWLGDFLCDQYKDGGIPEVIPNVLDGRGANAAGFADTAVVVPWITYLFYNDRELLDRHFESMRRWVLHIKARGDNPDEWNTGFQYGDWLAIDAEKGAYWGATSKSLIVTAFFAYSVSIVVKAGRILGYNVSEYEELHKNVVDIFKQEFVKNGRLTSETQTAYVLVIMFELVEDINTFGDILDELIENNGGRMTTGFVGTPYLLHALTKTGHVDRAYSLLLREEFPSWLYPITKGATTIWEHLDGIDEDGKLWSDAMNSFNHYTYGSVCEWLYNTVAGIRIDEAAPGFENVILCPIADRRLEWAEARVETAYGTIESKWKFIDGKIEYEFVVPNRATLILNGETTELKKGKYKFVCN